MRQIFFLAALLLLAAHAAQADPALPADVRAFMERRERCDHFRNEPAEGTSAEARKRRTYILRQAQRLCQGTDRQLAQLKQKYRGQQDVVQALGVYDDAIEAK